MTKRRATVGGLALALLGLSGTALEAQVQETPRDQLQPLRPRGDLVAPFFDGYYANPDAFEPPPLGEWGNAPRNSIRGPSQFSLNANASRNFTLRNRFRLNWSINATNLLNRVTYSNINTTVGSQQFGLPIAAGQMRQIRTSVNFGF